MMKLDMINGWSSEEAIAKLLSCCACVAWAKSMALRRPFITEQHLFEAADEQWQSLTEKDWLEAFAAHPRIGAKKIEDDSKHGQWARNEQAGMSKAGDQLRLEMAQLNHDYYERFGFVFLICATGKSADQMLMQLRRRITLERSEEIANAAREQGKITKIRLEKLL
tara:strand:- start:839 stop:1336 length:498 start_codon:yes stop_codon:yes gene_type:complete